MPAAAVIPAPMAYIKVVAFKKLVVGHVSGVAGPPLAVNDWLPQDVRPVRAGLQRSPSTTVPVRCTSLCVSPGRHIYFEQIRVLKAGTFA